jgi:hypothetical protein
VLDESAEKDTSIVENLPGMSPQDALKLTQYKGEYLNKFAQVQKEMGLTYPDPYQIAPEMKQWLSTDMKNMKTFMRQWTDRTDSYGAQVFRYISAEVEGLPFSGLPLESPVWDDALIAKFNSFISNPKRVEAMKDEYLRLRGLNQAYMEYYQRTPSVLWRGYGGRHGVKVVDTFRNIDFEEIVVQDFNASGWTSAEHVANNFAKFGGMKLRADIQDPLDILVHTDIMSLYAKYGGREAEFIMRRGDLIYKKNQIQITDRFPGVWE